MPSTITRSPGCRPSLMIQSEPMRSATFTATHAHLIVLADDGQLIAALHVGNRPLRHQQRAGARFDGRPDLRILARPQHIAGIGKLGGNANRPGLHINLPVGKSDFPLMRKQAAVGTAQGPAPGVLCGALSCMNRMYSCSLIAT